MAFAINRAYGPAVRRNRLRRQMRAILADLDRRQALPTGMMIIGARPGVRTELKFDVVTAELTQLVERARGCSG